MGYITLKSSELKMKYKMCGGKSLSVLFARKSKPESAFTNKKSKIKIKKKSLKIQKMFFCPTQKSRAHL